MARGGDTFLRWSPNTRERLCSPSLKISKVGVDISNSCAKVLSKSSPEVGTAPMSSNSIRILLPVELLLALIIGLQEQDAVGRRC